MADVCGTARSGAIRGVTRAGVIRGPEGGHAAPPHRLPVETAGVAGRVRRPWVPSWPGGRRRWARALGVLGGLLVIGMVGEPTTAMTTGPHADPPHGVVTVRAHGRRAPSRHSPVAAVLPAGAPVVRLEAQGAWSRIRTATGLDAWIHESLVRFDAEPLGPRASPADTATARLLAGEPLAGVLAPDPLRADAPDLPDAALGALFRRGCGPVTAAVVVVLLSAIGLQWRAARQFQWAMGELGALLEIVEALATTAAAVGTDQHPPASCSPRPRAASEVGDAPAGEPGGAAGETPPGPG